MTNDEDKAILTNSDVMNNTEAEVTTKLLSATTESLRIICECEINLNA